MIVQESKSTILIQSKQGFGKAAADRVAQDTEFSVILATDDQTAKSLYEEHSAGVFAAIIDCGSCGKERQEILDSFLERGLPVIVLTSEINDQDGQALWKRGVFDIVYDDLRGIEHVVCSLNRLARNRRTKVLAVDDCPIFRTSLVHKLGNQCFLVFEAANGIEALAVLKKEPDIRIVVADYSMPEMDGFEMTRSLRVEFAEDELAIIGLSGIEDKYLAARFMKFGANDFLYKDDLVDEELYARLNLWASHLELIRDLKNTGINDPLTGLYSRRYLYDYGKRVVESASYSEQTVCAVIEIDYFSMLIEGLGYEAGDFAVQSTAGFIKSFLSADDIVARIDDCRFCVLFDSVQSHAVFTLLEKMRQQIAVQPFVQGDGLKIDLTISVGCWSGEKVPFATLVDKAAQLVGEVQLYSGNGVIVCSGDTRYATPDMQAEQNGRCDVCETLSTIKGKDDQPHAAKKVLLVDDSKIIKKIVGGYLQRIGNIEYQEARNGRDGLEKLRAEKFDIVFFDIAMPVMNGLQAAAIARKEYPDLVIIMLTAEHTMRREAADIGVNGYLTKPFNFAAVRDCLTEHGLI